MICLQETTDFRMMLVFSLIQNAKAIFILTPKCNKNPLLSLSYRPLMLSNIDYNIIATVINGKMKCYLNQLISSGQNSFTKDSHIGDNIRLFLI